jgi:hypothetical protein
MTSTHRARLGLTITVSVLAWLLVQQLSVIASIGNDLSPTGDRYSEADAIRAAQHYAEFGFMVDAGLPHIVHGARFPNDGWVVDLDQPLASGVYTRYPPLPDLLAGLYEKVFGFDHLWAWRLVPLLLSLAAILFAFLELRAVLDPAGAGVLTFLLAAVPLITSHMHGLHFEAYAHALLLVQLALLTRFFLAERAPSRTRLVVLAGVGFVQGWLSYDYAFVVMLAAVPIALLIRAWGHSVPNRRVLLYTALGAGGFVLAAVLHVVQVAVFYHSFSQALADLAGRAAYRSVGNEAATTFGSQVWSTSVAYGRLLWLAPNPMQPLLQNTPAFGALLPLLSVFVLAPGSVDRTNSSSGILARVRGGIGPRLGSVAAMCAAYGIAWLWIIVMPSHAAIHRHFVPHIFFLAYFVVALDAVQRWVPVDPPIVAT